jgi:hypothetical protein
MILESIGIAAGVAALIQTARKGIPVSSGTLGDPVRGDAIKWRVRWAIWRWVAEIQSPLTGWTVAGEFPTKGIAEAAAKAAGFSYQLAATGKPIRMTRVR